MSLPRPRRDHLHWWLLGGLVGTLLFWITFFDSHSLLRRYRWSQELESLQQENQALRMEIDNLQEKLEQPLSDKAVERIAREQYGMKRPNETIYRLRQE